MKKTAAATILFLSLLVRTVPASPRAAENLITISRIKIKINEDLYVWEEKKSMPAKAAGAHTAPSTVVTFLDFAPGDKLTPGKLQHRLDQAQRRLTLSSLFYAVRAVIIPPQKNPGTRTVLITLVEGFPYRFGAGYAYGKFGIDNIGGTRKSLRIYAGYNYAGVSFVDEHLGNSRGVLGGSGMYIRSKFRQDDIASFHAGRGTILAGFRPHPDLFLGSTLNLQYTWFFNIARNAGGIDPTLNAKRERVDLFFGPLLTGKFAYGNLRNPLLLTFQINGFASVPINERLPLLSIAVRAGIVIPVFWQHAIALQLSGGSSEGTLPYPYKFDLYYTDDQSIRSGYRYTELIADHFWLCNIEYRFKIISFSIPPFFNVVLSGFLFVDLGGTVVRGKPGGPGDVKDAQGIGFRILLDRPIDAGITLSYGVNSDKSGRFFFVGTVGF